MNLDEITDFANDVNREIASYAPDIILNPDRLLADDFTIPRLNWYAVSYGEDDLNLVPDDKRGIYAFAVRIDNPDIPSTWLYPIHWHSRKKFQSFVERTLPRLSQHEEGNKTGLA